MLGNANYSNDDDVEMWGCLENTAHWEYESKLTVVNNERLRLNHVVSVLFTMHCYVKFKWKSQYGQQSVGQSVLVSGAHLGPVTNFSFSLKFPLDSCSFVILWHPLWGEDGSVIYLYRVRQANPRFYMAIAM
jgi:hypothetical protein